MSHHLLASEAAVVHDAAHPTERLRRLYVGRSVFALAWAGAFALSAATLNPVSGTLLVLYPVVDLAAAVVDHRSFALARSRKPLVVNMALSLITAIGLVVAAASGAPSVLRVWGAWALTAGLVQLVVAIPRRRLGGQWPMILSGAISMLAGTSFILMAARTKPSLTSLAGYAALGGIFFLASALRLHRPAQTVTTD